MKTLENYIGQKEAVMHFRAVCDAVAEERTIPFSPVVLTGPAGLGKTRLMDLVGEELSRITSGKFKTVNVNAATSLPDFINLWINHIEDKDVVVKWDEIHALSKKMVNFLKPILETQRSVKVIEYGDIRLTVNPFRIQHIAATNTDHGDEALIGHAGRFRRIPFIPYTQPEVKEIMRLMEAKWKGKFKLHGDAVEFLSRRVLPNGRSIADLIEGICLLHGGLIDLKTAKEICALHGFFPLGLRKADLATLQFLGRDTNGRQVNEIASASDETDVKSTSYRLQWLARFSFIHTKNGKKFLSPAGHEYLQAIAESQRKAKTAKKAKTASASSVTVAAQAA